MLEALLLIGIVFFLDFVDAARPWVPVILAVALLFCAPLVRMSLTKAPPFVPTPNKRVRTMVELANIREGERASDLGCGDGRLVREAAKKGANATGYELSLPTYALAKVLSIATPRATIRYGNFWTKDFRETDIVFAYLLIQTMQQCKDTIWPQLKPGARFVSHMFKLPGVEPTVTKDSVYVYIKE